MMYGTDKASAGHGYCHVYESLLWPLRDEQITLLEIGVWEGASLAMWREYFPHAAIVGLDIDTSRARGDYIEGTHVRQGDTTNDEFIREVINEYGTFDIVVDDGAHIAAISQHEYSLLWPHVAPGGLYFVEDLHTYWWERANPAGSEEWLFDLARDCIGRGDSAQDGMTHTTDIESVRFSRCMAVIKKRG